MTEAEAKMIYARLQEHSSDFRKEVAHVRRKHVCVEGPMKATLTLYGHCPSKKNLWERGTSGKMFLNSETKKQIDTLTTQALFQWKLHGPVEHPEITSTFFVCAQRQDEDGMYTTILDCLQAAGVLLNDNIAHNNGRKIHEPCVMVSPENERAEIILTK